MLVIERPATQFARGLHRDRSGVAMIEFAFALPMLLTMAMGGMEVANFAIATLRVNQIAMMAADNAARVRSTMDETDVNEVMSGVKFAGTGIKLGANGRVILSVLEANGQTSGNAGYKITWQRCFGAKNVTSSYGAEGAGATNATLVAGMGPTGRKIVPVANSGLVFAEVRYTYVPLMSAMFFGSTRELTALQSFPVRERAAQALTNSTNMAAPSKRLCDAAHLSPN